MPSSKTTGVGIFGFQAETDLICPLEIKLAQEFLPDATRALDFAEYLTFQIGLFIAENFVIAASVLFEYVTFPPCNSPVLIELQFLVVLFKVALPTTCNTPDEETFIVMASNLLKAFVLRS